MFYTSYQRDEESSKIDSSLVNAIISNEIFVDEDEPHFGVISSPPNYTRIADDYSFIVHTITKGKFTRAFWLLMLDLYVIQPDFKIFILSLIRNQNIGKTEGLQLKGWFKQRVVGGYYFSKEINNLFSFDNYKAFNEAKFKLLVVAFKHYLFYRNERGH